MIDIDCSEMTVDEQISLASAVSDGLAGRGVALVKDDRVVVDQIAGKVTAGEVAELAKAFAARRKDPQLYTVETDGEHVVVHTPDPLSRARGRKDTGQLLPDNLFKCPFCPFVTPYEEAYVVHYRSHGFG
ncbi:MAG: hypothetical protein JRN16_07475 [Nitrososphaerota archaeon]|nr:hypothetical protein [Nitrososphaerota archaeon]MDG6975899.1 hypothetical protein [Nitrososphaerota archaeon]MDG7016136.1 hypothetical protein [Nitrososphaerota archaeon]MDG7018415.1 hypothetical protein [Nitrososphaerota archaeon]MDG7020152.1 hypothetical protein [Nitrososphaerota archaeon]